MSVIRRRGILFLQCDICGVRRNENLKGQFEVAHGAYWIAKNDGWRFDIEKGSGKRQAFCPDCALAGTDYTLDQDDPYLP